MVEYRIPRQTDRSLLSAVIAVRNELKELLPNCQIQAMNFEPGGQQITLPDAPPENSPVLAEVLSQESEIMPWVQLRLNNQTVLQVTRQFNQVTDSLNVPVDQNFVNQIQQDRRNVIIPKLISSARKHLRAADTEAAVTGASDSAWNRYRDAQQGIISSLEQTLQTILSEYTRKSLEQEADAKARLELLEKELEEKFKSSQETLEKNYKAKSEQLDDREKAIEERAKSFNTKEARYVARSEQQKQIDQIKDWLQDWSLTRGTRSKRYVVTFAYFSGALVSLFFAIWFSYENIEILKVAEADLSKVPWWQWLILAFKGIFPVAALITFIIYFIRWSSEWARQHADEEFRNRTRVLDIGRSAWLLEAVRDAQDSQKELPPELVKELTTNLFAYSAPADVSDLHPQAVTDLIMQGLASLRVKTPDGTEVEAIRGKKK